MNLRRKPFFLLAIACVSAAVLFWQPWKGPQEQNVLSAKIRKGSLAETVSAVGTLEPLRLVQVGAQVTGQLKAIHVSLGSQVKAGDLIAEIDSLQQQNELRLAEASLEEAQATKRSRLIALERARLIFERQQTLREGNAGSGADLLDAEASLKTAQSDIDLAEAQIAKATVEVEKARTNLTYTRILAPIDGKVIGLAAEPGQTLNAAQTTPVIAVIAQTDTMKVRAQISEADVGRIAPGQRVHFSTFGDRTTLHESTLGAVEPAPQSILWNQKEAGAQSGAGSSAQAVYYGAVFEADNPGDRLKPSMTANITIYIASVDNALLVPLQALQGQDKNRRYKVTVRTGPDATEERLVEIGISDRISAQVISGLEEGEEVILPIEPEAAQPAGHSQ